MFTIDKLEKSEKYTFKTDKKYKMCNSQRTAVNFWYIFFQYSIYEYFIFIPINI